MRSKQYLLPIFLAVSLSLSACNDDGGGGRSSTKLDPIPTAPSVADQKKEHVVLVGIDPSYAPFVSKKEDGSIVGFDVELLTEIGKRQGFEIQLVPKPWSGIFDNLETKSVDVIIGGAVATEERKQKWAVSKPYAAVTTVLLTKNESGIKKFEDAKGKKVAYTQGGSVEKVLKELQGVENLDTSQNVSSSWLRVKNVLVGASDAAIGTSASFEYYAKTYPEQNLQIVYPTNPTYDDVAFILRKDNQELLTKINNGLQSMQSDGTLEKLKAEWLK